MNGNKKKKKKPMLNMNKTVNKKDGLTLKNKALNFLPLKKKRMKNNKMKTMKMKIMKKTLIIKKKTLQSLNK
jgi:hypothetical protein